MIPHRLRTSCTILCLLCQLALRCTAQNTVAPTGSLPIAFQQDGVLKVQAVTGGPSHKATASEATAWQNSPNKYHGWVSAEEFPLLSPDGKYRMVVTRKEQEGQPQVYFEVARVSDGKKMLTPQQILRVSKIAPDEFNHPEFGGWLADSKHFVLTTDNHISSNDFRTRCLLNAETRHLSRFNGWLAPDLRTAIVPAKEGVANDEELHISGDKNYQYGMIGYYAVHLTGSLDTYRLANVSKVRLRLDRNHYEIGLASDVAFSPDGKWAIADGETLISLTTGEARRLGGKDARFLRGLSVASTPNTLTQGKKPRSSRMEIAEDVARQLVAAVRRKDWTKVSSLYEGEGRADFLRDCKRLQTNFMTLRVTTGGLNQSAARGVSVGLKAPDGWEPNIEVDVTRRKITAFFTNDD